MEDKKTIFNYTNQLFATFGVIVLIFSVFTLLVGEQAREMSSLYALGREGMTVSTLMQHFLLALVITVTQNLFLTDRWIKNMTMALRYTLFFSTIFVAIVVFIFSFDWFPVNSWIAWLCFALCFIPCTVVSIVISSLAEKAENKKMEEALKRFK